MIKRRNKNGLHTKPVKGKAKARPRLVAKTKDVGVSPASHAGNPSPVTSSAIADAAAEVKSSAIIT